MAIHIAYQSPEGTALVSRADGMPDMAWEELKRTARERDGRDVGADAIELPWLGFLSLTPTVLQLQRDYGFRSTYSPEALERVRRHVSSAQQLRSAQSGSPASNPITEEELYSRLVARGWDRGKRELTDKQLRDALAMLTLPAGANFSVPGAGKTTVALAVNLAGTDPGTKLLVVAPKNAFPAWDNEVLKECLVSGFTPFVRLTGGAQVIRQKLLTDPQRSIISYAQLVRAEAPIVEFLNRHQVHLILDESHRIKAGELTQSGAVATRIGPLAVRRDMLSGTPMPQAVTDLASQFDFLWPGHGLGARIRTAPTPAPVIRPLYQRTTKRELGLDPVIPHPQAIEMSDPQRLLYAVLRDDFFRQLTNLRPRDLPRRAATPVMRLLQAVIDPQTAVSRLLESGFTVPDSDLSEIYRLVLEEDVSPRMRWVEAKVRELVAQNNKAVVWTPFRQTIRRLQERLADLGAEALDGSTPSGDPEEDDTRESILKRFHNGRGMMVLVANPAAGGEGISLHRVCHHAIYLGRTYNAAHFLQSRDRIHRLGLPKGTETHIYLTESLAPARLGSIDMSVRRRLDAKVADMSAALEDEDLRALSLESEEADPSLDDGLEMADLRDLIAELQEKRSDDRKQ